MNDEQFAYFRRLVETIGPSGYEEAAQAIWCDRVRDAADSLKIDRLGNAIAALNPSGRPRVMLDAHIDQIGFIVRHIDEEGFIYFATIGGFDPSTLAGNRVKFIGKHAEVPGVIGRKPIHLLDQDDRKKSPELKNMWIDIGAANREAAQELLGIGDAGGRAAGMERLQGNLVACAALDDRVGSYMMAEAFRELAKNRPRAGVFAASSVQEEIGLRGARVSAYDVDTEVGLALEVTWTSDHPQASKTELGDIRVGSGPVMFRGANTNPKVFRRLVQAAEAAGAPYQIDAIAGGTPTDQNAMQMTRSGMATGLLSVPTRYLHTASEILSLDDVDAGIAIIVQFIQDLDEDVDLTL